MFDAISQANDDLVRIGGAVALAVASVIIGRIVRAIAVPILTKRQTPSFGRVVSRLIGWSVAGFGIVIAITIAFPSVKPVDFIAGLGIFSIALGFAFQDILSNLLAGLLLIIRQPFQQGDQIEVDGQHGTVEGITIRETTLKTFDGERIIIPNADVYQSAIRVQTAFEQRRTNLTIGVGYDANLRHAEQAILEAARAADGVLEDPAPQAYLIELGDSAVVFDLRYWTEPEQATVRKVMSDVLREVKERLDRESIDMPFPVRTLEASPGLQELLGGRATGTASAN